MESKEFYDFLLKVQSISKIGLIFSKDPYAITNYKEINDLSTKFLEDFENVKFDRPNYFARDIYPTPNVSVRTVILNKEKTKVLMVKEVNLQAYSLPGGWSDLYDSPSKTARNECMQEAGANIDIVRLVGITDRTPFKNPTSIPEYVIIFEARLVGELQEHEYETDDVGWFDVDNLPLISKKTSKQELERFIKAAINGETIYD
ncbi:MAG: NUDIX domain-containing protein [Erysipelotrichaceae bacterium]|nr:NUDIX domain-containing protein [Erysipelotrichaceae bacterium]